MAPAASAAPAAAAAAPTTTTTAPPAAAFSSPPFTARLAGPDRPVEPERVGSGDRPAQHDARAAGPTGCSPSTSPAARSTTAACSWTPATSRSAPPASPASTTARSPICAAPTSARSVRDAAGSALRLRIQVSIDQATQRVTGTLRGRCGMTTATTNPSARGAPPAGLPRLLAAWRPGAPVGFDEHLAHYGPPPWAGRRRKGTPDLVQTLEASGLRGRGGAGFPTARKLRRGRAGPGRPPGRGRERLRGGAGQPQGQAPARPPAAPRARRRRAGRRGRRRRRGDRGGRPVGARRDRRSDATPSTSARRVGPIRSPSGSRTCPAASSRARRRRW